MRKLSSKQSQPEDSSDGYAMYTSTGSPRRVRVKGMQGVDVTVVVTVVQGKVWMSISPPFTWEAIMEPGKVDEVMQVLEVARDEAKKMVVMRNRNAARGSKAVVRAITTGGSATQ
jgi:hypothetical protein